MKYFFVLLFFTFTINLHSQSEIHQKKFDNLEPDIWMGIWDKENSSKTIKIDTLSYDDIPKYLDFRGTVVEAIKWTDKLGENILIQTVTGHFKWKDYESTSYTNEDKSELYAYLFRKKSTEKTYKKVWRLYDFTKCFGVDWSTKFIKKATTITDLDGNGITEITMPYILICRGGMDPGTMKIIMYENNTKYALRGETMLMCNSENPYGGEYKPSKNLSTKKTFANFLKKHWDNNKCE